MKILSVPQNSLILFLIALLIYFSFSNLIHKFERLKFIFVVLYSMFFSLAAIIGNKIKSDELYGGRIDVNYFMDFAKWDLINFILFFVSTIAVLYFLSDLLENKKVNLIKDMGMATQKRWISVGFIIFAYWIPYFILYYPGLIYGDSLDSINQALGTKNLSNHFPLFYTLAIKFCLAVGYRTINMNFGCAIYTVLQMLYISMVLAYTVSWLREKGVSKTICGFTIAFYLLSPVYAIHAISMWKDPVFSVTLMFLSLKLYDAVKVQHKLLNKTFFLIQYVLSGIIICLSRNNGIYIMTFVTICVGVILVRLVNYNIQRKEYDAMLLQTSCENYNVM